MRSKYRWGAEVIKAHLLHDHSIELTKYRIDRDKYPCTTKKVRKKQKSEHKRVVRIFHPGEHTQMDTKHQPHILENGKKCYVFNFIDHASNWSYKRAYESISPKSTIDFMKRLLSECPFKIHRIQTDNGTEYTYKFYKRYTDIEKVHPLEKFCADHNIIHKLILPGKKELQGLVERSHRQDDQELFSRIEPQELEEFNYHLDEYFRERNKGRRFKKLNWMSPDEWLREYKTLSRVLEFGHYYRGSKRDEDLLPKQKNSELPKSSAQVTKLKNTKSVNSCKDRRKKDDKNDIKQAA